MTDAEEVTRLRAEAHNRGLHWVLFCTSQGESDSKFKFLAMCGRHRENLLKIYIEDGAEDHWFAYGATQGEAAWNLLKALDGDPNDIAEHKKPENNEQCAPELRGD
jgi:hypothetical protein